MTVKSALLTLRLFDAASLKDKRRVAKSIIAKTRQRFNAAIAEVDAQDSRETLILGAAVVSGSFAHAQNMLDEVIRFIETNPEAELISVQTE